jgi:hypothetical protein
MLDPENEGQEQLTRRQHHIPEDLNLLLTVFLMNYT